MLREHLQLERSHALLQAHAGSSQDPYRELQVGPAACCAYFSWHTSRNIHAYSRHKTIENDLTPHSCTCIPPAVSDIGQLKTRHATCMYMDTSSLLFQTQDNWKYITPYSCIFIPPPCCFVHKTIENSSRHIHVHAYLLLFQIQDNWKRITPHACTWIPPPCCSRHRTIKKIKKLKREVSK